MLFSCEKKKTNIRNVLIKAAGSLMLGLMLCLVLGITVKAEIVKGTATVTANSLNIRSGPGKEYDAIGKVSAGDVLDASEIDGEWIKITYNNKEGYVALEYVEFEPDEEFIEEETQEEELTAEAADVEVDDTAETEDESSLADYKIVFILLGIIVVVMIIILLTIKSIKDMDRDDEYDDDEYDDDEYDDDEYEEDDEVDYEEDDEVDYEEEDDDEYEYEHIIVRRPKQSTNKKKSNSDDYSINIDPRYFD